MMNRFSVDLVVIIHTIACTHQHIHPRSMVRALCVPTLAISSLFLNSPLRNVTFPFSSSSVHRNLNSFDALFAIVVRPKFDIVVSVPSPRDPVNGGGTTSSDLEFLFLFLDLLPKSKKLHSHGLPAVVVEAALLKLLSLLG